MAGPWDKFASASQAPASAVPGGAAPPVPQDSDTTAGPWSKFKDKKSTSSFGDLSGAKAALPQDELWLDVGKSAFEHLPESAVKFGGDMAAPIMHPIKTAENLGNLGQGVLEETGLSSGTEHKKYAQAVGKFLADRYGGMDQLKHTIATDPVGFAADVSSLFLGGEAVAARAPGMIGRAGEIAGDVGRAVDPIAAAGRVAKGAGHVASEVVGNLGTHTGGEALRRAAVAGYRGGSEGKAFQENIRGNEPMTDVVDDARQAVNNMRQQRGAAYRSGMSQHIATDPTVLDFKKIDTAVQGAGAIKNYKGQNLSPSAAGINTKMSEAIEEWKNLDPKQFHTVEGLDALKQKLGDIRDATQYGTPERVAADRIYHAVRKTILEQAPEYGKIMKGYEEASSQIKEIEKALSLNQNASVDTALRKLQSALRDNVNTSYGSRKALAEYIEKSGAKHLMARLAGQALRPWTARGLGKLGMQIGAEIALTAGSPDKLAALAASVPFMSPRITGEGAYYAGKGAKLAGKVPAGARLGEYQAGRTSDVEDNSSIRPMTPEEEEALAPQ